MSHDYQPHWDYEVVEVATLAADETRAVSQTMAQARSRLLPALGFDDFELFCTVPGGLGRGRVGCYVDGTASRPVIGVDIALLKAHSTKLELDWIEQLRATVAHELAHAHEEANARRHCERAAEAFARAFASEGRVDVELLWRRAAGRGRRP